MITVNEMRNVTMDGNVTELQGVVTYDITELRMNPNYIRYQDILLLGFKFKIWTLWSTQTWDSVNLVNPFLRLTN